MTEKKQSNLPDKTPYVHTHTLADGTTYTHSHAHGSKDKHTHATASASEVPESTESMSTDPDRLIALLTFYVEHNEQHAGELAALLPMLPSDVQDKMTLAIGTFEAANVDLSGVLEYMIQKRKEG